MSAPAANGRVILDPADLSHSTVHITVQAAALTVTGEGEPADDVPEVQQTMESARVLDVSHFPEISLDNVRNWLISSA